MYKTSCLSQADPARHFKGRGDPMNATVAIVHIHQDYAEALRQALAITGGIAGLNSPDREVTIKVGIFDPRSRHHSSVETVRAIIEAFDLAPRIYLAESDNYCGKALDRIRHCYGELLSERVVPFNLSEDPSAQQMPIAGEEQMAVSSILLKPRVLVSTHVLRSFIKGSILKNLFGCTPAVQKAKYHKTEIFANQLADLAQAAGGIDLAVMDGTNLYYNATEKHIPMDLLIVGRDAVAVETVGAVLAGMKPEKVQPIPEFVRRGLGQGTLDQIEILGLTPVELSELKKAHKELKKLVDAAPKPLGVSKTIDALVEEGWLDTCRRVPEVVDELKKRGVANATPELVETTLKRRTGKSLERSKDGRTPVYKRLVE
jgi:uncharacterized protein (DUF362 family)